MRKTEILISNLVFLGLSIPELSKILMYEFWYDYLKPKYNKKAKLSDFIVYIKTDNIYKDIAEDVKTRFDTSNRPLYKEKQCNCINEI